MHPGTEYSMQDVLKQVCMVKKTKINNPCNQMIPAWHIWTGMEQDTRVYQRAEGQDPSASGCCTCYTSAQLQSGLLCCTFSATQRLTFQTTAACSFKQKDAEYVLA